MCIQVGSMINKLIDLINKMYCRCSGDAQCEAYQHQTPNCVLMEGVGIIDDKSQIFVSNENKVIYKKGILDSSYIPVEKNRSVFV